MALVIESNKNLSKDDASASRFSVRRRFLVVALVIVIVLLGFQYLYITWGRYSDDEAREAIVLSESLQSLLHPDHIAQLSGSTQDINKPEYKLTKSSLVELADTNNRVKFAYLLSEQDGQLVFLVDSEPINSLDYSPPGQVYTEADEYCWQAFRTGETVISEPSTDRWGTWISALVPIKDPASNQVLAVLGLDYDAEEWNLLLWQRMSSDFIIVASVLVLFFILLRVWNQRSILKKISARMKKSESLYRSVFSQAPIGIAIVSDTKFVLESEPDQSNINPALEKILGRERSELEQIEWPDITHPDDLDADVELFEQFKAGKNQGYIMEKRFLRPDGSYIWTNMTISPLLDMLEKMPMHLLLLEDISARKSADEELKKSERSKSVLLSNLPGMAYRCKNNSDWTMLYVSEGCYELTGYEPEDFLYNNEISLDLLAAPQYRQEIREGWERLSSKKESFRLKFEYEIITASGERKWVLELAEGVSDESGEIEAIEGLILDISDKKMAEDTLRFNSEHDRWTGLFNRTYLEGLLNHDINQTPFANSSTEMDSILTSSSATKRSTLNRALIKINLRAMQSLTATYGFHQTKELMRRVSAELRKYCTGERMLFSTYEHRFVFYIRSYTDTAELTRFCEDIVSALRKVLAEERIGGGIGVYEIDPKEGSDADILLRNPLLASERAFVASNKDFGICFYDEDLQATINREEEIKRLLARIATGEDDTGLLVHYQPIVQLDSNRIQGFEALARLRNDSLGLVSPLEFIPLAENTKLIIPIGEVITTQALQFQKRLGEAGYEDVRVSINVSAIQLLSEDFCTNLFRIIEDSGVDASNIGIEITESVFASDFNEINSIINKLRDYGLYIAIDDFGVGYSSLARERELNINCLKIDKYFIDNINLVEPDNTITSDIVSIAHKLGHCAVAEGVETESQRQYLIDCQCDSIQGYLISRPLDEEAAMELLAEYQNQQNPLG